MLAFRLSGVAAALLLAGCSAQIAPRESPSTTTSPSPSVNPTPSATPSSTPATVALTAGSIHPESVTFISPDVGWVLGISACGDSSCLRLAKTADAGGAWMWVTSTGLSALSTDTQWRVRFANSEDGWISGPLLFATHDAGSTWTRVAFPREGSSGASVDALETADGRVYAEIAEGIEPNTDGPAVLFESPTNRDSWQPVSGVTTGKAGYAGEISVAQGVFWATLHPAVLTAEGNTETSTLYRSLDGVTWRSEPQPCQSGWGATVAAATSARVFIVCSGGGAAGSQEKMAYVSDNDGASYAPVSDPPLGGDFEAVAASPTGVSVAAASGATYIYASFDGGATWATALGIGDGGLGLSDLGFTTATQGVVIHGQTNYPQSLQLLMTRDGGHQWEPVPVSPT
jgi:hypothetical protein